MWNRTCLIPRPNSWRFRRRMLSPRDTICRYGFGFLRHPQMDHSTDASTWNRVHCSPIFLMIVIAFIPIWLSAFANLNTALDEPDRFPWLAMGNPIEMIESANSMRRPVSNDDRIGLYWSASLYSFVALLFTALTWKSRQRLPRRRL